jgi:uncharacterized protein YkwD
MKIFLSGLGFLISLSLCSACASFSTTGGLLSASISDPTVTATMIRTAIETATSIMSTTETPSPEAAPTETTLSTEMLTPVPVEPIKIPITSGDGGCSGENSDMESTVLGMINAQRTQNGIGTVDASSSMADIARAYSRSMAENGFFGHGDVGTRVNASGAFTAVGEIIYAGPGSYDSASEAIAHWMKSPKHREMLLSPVYTLAGVGYWCDPHSVHEGYFTVDFARP